MTGSSCGVVGVMTVGLFGSFLSLQPKFSQVISLTRISSVVECAQGSFKCIQVIVAALKCPYTVGYKCTGSLTVDTGTAITKATN